MTLQIRTSPSIPRERLHIFSSRRWLPRGITFVWFFLGRAIDSEPLYRHCDRDARVKSAFTALISRAARVYTIVIKIIVDILAATVLAPPFCPNYFLTRPIKGAGSRRWCSSGSSRQHNRKTGRPSVIKTARVGVQTSLALSSSRFLIFFFFLSLSFSLSFFPRVFHPSFSRSCLRSWAE